MGESFQRGFVGAAGAFTFALLLALLLSAFLPPLEEGEEPRYGLRRCGGA